MAFLSTQQFLEIENIREGIVILKNKSLKAIIMVSSVNFVLKSEEEQQAIIYQFQNFLNSLDFPIQVVIQSRRINLTGYLEKLAELEKNQKNELLKYQTSEYRKFITQLVKGGQIFSKNFFVVIPYSFFEAPGFKKGKEEIDEKKFQVAKFQLEERIQFVIQGLRRCGLDCYRLGSAELIQLFWSLYHPSQAESGYYPEILPELIT